LSLRPDARCIAAGELPQAASVHFATSATGDCQWLPGEELQELVAYVKANPGKVSYGTGGAGTPAHIMAADFSQRVAPPNIIHYRGRAITSPFSRNS
jgi:tripartite-type tricarboxylate transporter receptor subunit TctC